jgi:uncharacterized iron-regulated membrane protein
MYSCYVYRGDGEIIRTINRLDVHVIARFIQLSFAFHHHFWFTLVSRSISLFFSLSGLSGAMSFLTSWFKRVRSFGR